MQIKLSQYASKRLEILKEHLQAEDSDVVEEAVIQLYDSYVQKGEIQEERQPSSLIEALSREGLLKRRFKCTRNALPDTQEELFIEAENEEDAWQQMAARFPIELETGFDIKEVQPFNFLD
jgi:competence protein ComGC